MSNNQYFSQETFFNEEVKFYKDIYVYGTLHYESVYTDAGITYNPSTNTLTVGTFSGSGASLTNIPNSSLSNSTISGVSLGSNLNTLTLNTSGSGISGSTTYNGSVAATFTVTSNATSSNTGSTIVARDASGNFSAGTITATSLVKSGGTSSQFLKADGSVDSNTYITSSSIGNGTLTLAVSGTGLSGSASFAANQSGNSTFTVTSNATSSNTGSTIVARDASGNFSAGLITSGTAFRVGNANLSSGGDYAHLATYEYYNGSSWVYQSATAGGLYQITGQAHNWYKHNGAGTHTTLLTLDASGNLVATANVTAYSDIKLKENINTIENALDKTLKLRGVTFTRKDIPEEGIQIGVIAQEVEEIIPEVVKLNNIETPEGIVDEIKTVAYGNMVGLLIEAIKEQQKTIEKLEKRIGYLESK